MHFAKKVKIRFFFSMLSWLKMGTRFFQAAYRVHHKDPDALALLQSYRISWQKFFQFNNCIHHCFEMGSRQSLRSKKKSVEKVHFLWFELFNYFCLIFSSNTNMVCFDSFKSKKSRKIQVFSIKITTDFCFWNSNFHDSPFLSQLT